MAARDMGGRGRRGRRPGLQALAAVLLGATALTLGSPPTPAPAAVTESVDGPVGYFSITTPTSRSVPLSGTTASSIGVLNTGGVPASGVSAVVVNVTVAAPSSSTGLFVYPAGAPSPTEAMHVTAGGTQSTLVTTKVGTGGQITFKSGGGASTPVTAVVVGFYALQQGCWSPCVFHNRFSPALGSTLYDGVARPGSAGVALNESSLPQQIPIPGGADQAVVRVSVLPDAPVTTAVRRVDVRAGGATSTPSTGQISFFGNTTPSRVLTVPIASGRIDVLVPDTSGNDGANLRVVVDLLGTIDGTEYSHAATGSHASGLLPDVTLTHGAAVTNLELRAAGGLPATYQALQGAVVLNVTVKDASAAGKVSLDAGGTIAHVAFGAGSGVVGENQVIVPISSSGTTVPLKYTASGGSGTRTAKVEVDYVGSYQFGSYANPGTNSGDLFTAVPQSAALYDQTLAGSTPADLQVLGRAGVPTSGVSRVALVVHSIGAVGATDVTLAGHGRAMPTEPQLATSVARSSALVVVEPGTDGRVQLLVGAAQTRVVVSVVGWFTPYAGNGPQDRSVSLIGDTLTDEVDDDVMGLVDQGVRLNSYGLTSSARAEGLAHWADTNALSRPSKVILNLGTFDAKNGTNPASDTRDRIVEHLDRYMAAPCRFVVTVNEQTASMEDRAEDINDVLEAVATPDSRIGVIDWNAYLLATGPSGQVGTDGLPTAAGYTALAGLYAEAISGDGLGAAAAYVTPCSSTASYFPARMGTPLDPPQDPDLTIDAGTSHTCHTENAASTREPLLLVGSGNGTSAPWYTALDGLGRFAQANKVCTLTIPADPLSAGAGPFMSGDQADFTRAAQHVVRAIRAIATTYGSDVDVVATSRGGLDLRWALRWWPDLRDLVDDAVLLGVPNHGSRWNMYTAAEADSTPTPDGAADNNSIPAIQQSRADSLFEMALNSMDETPGGVDYTNLASDDDHDSMGTSSTEDDRTHAWMLDGATNVLLQDHCPGTTLTRPDVANNAWIWAAVDDALGPDGPAVSARIGTATCVGGTTSDPVPNPTTGIVSDSEPPLPDYVPMDPQADAIANDFDPELDDVEPDPSTRVLDEPGLVTDHEDYVEEFCRPDEAVNGPLLLVDGGGGQGGPAEPGSLYDIFDGLHRFDTGTHPVCWITLPAPEPVVTSPAADLAKGAQYVVNAVQAIEDVTGTDVDILTHSRGGFDTRWALKWWPDIHDKVDDVLILGSPIHGSEGRKYSDCDRDDDDICHPLTIQSRSDSRFMAALEIGDQTPGDASYTTIGSWDDGATVVRAFDTNGPLDARQYAWRLPEASNIVVQQHCAGARLDHGQILTDPWVWAAVQDALTNTGGADPGRFVPQVDCHVGTARADFHPYPAFVVGPTPVVPLDEDDEPMPDYVWLTP